MKKKEILALLLVVVIAGGVWLFTHFQHRYHEYIEVINQQQKVLLKVPLRKDGDYQIKGEIGYFHLEVKNGQYRAHDVDCPDKVCESIGWVSKDNYMPIICLPNGIMVVLSDE